MAFGGVTDLIDTLDIGVHCGIKTDRIVTAGNIVIDGFWYTDKANWGIDLFTIVAEFSNGETRLLDFSELVTSGRGMLKMLADKEYFRHFTLDPFTIDWNNEIGFEPEYLYAMSKPLPKYYADNVKHDMVAEEVHRG